MSLLSSPGGSELPPNESAGGCAGPSSGGHMRRGALRGRWVRGGGAAGRRALQRTPAATD